MRVLVCGSRDWTDGRPIAAFIEGLNEVEGGDGTGRSVPGPGAGGGVTRRRYSPVKVTKADGTVETRPAYTQREASGVRHHGERAAGKGVTRAVLEQSCSYCGETITVGMQMVGFLNPPRQYHWPQCRHAVYSERRRRR